LLLALVAGVVFALRRRRLQQQQQLSEGFGGPLSMLLPAQPLQQPYAPLQ